MPAAPFPEDMAKTSGIQSEKRLLSFSSSYLASSIRMNSFIYMTFF
jgi:hypothetical protein